MAKSTTIPFEKWNLDMLFDNFGLQQVRKMTALTEWQDAINTLTITADEKKYLDILREKIFADVENWNEEEVKMKSIFPILSLVDFEINGFKVFAQRKLSTVLDNIPLSGKPEWIVAKGISMPKNPYFFIHQYKKKYGNSADPRAQLLVAMLAAQQVNATNLPLYGLYVAGKSWNFVVLQGREYAVTDTYTATQTDIYDILKLLFFIKNQLLTL
jgi:hypothetical protein